jgi:hypothetical protein
MPAFLAPLFWYGTAGATIFGLAKGIPAFFRQWGRETGDDMGKATIALSLAGGLFLAYQLVRGKPK